MRHHQDNERGRLAKHPGQPVKCEQCGHLARRKARQQLLLGSMCDARSQRAVSPANGRWRVRKWRYIPAGIGFKNVTVPSRVNQGAWRRANPYNLDTAQRS